MAYADRDRVLAWLADGHGDKLTTLDRAVLTTIAQYVNSQTGLSWRGVDYLATVWGVDSRSIKRSIARLHQLGYLETAERGTGQRRARYRLAGELINTEVGGHSGHPTQTEVGGPKQQSRGTETTKKGDPGVTRISKSSRSYSGEMTLTDGATHRAPLGSLGAAPDVVDQIRTTLNLTADEAAKWIEACLTDRQVSNVDAYLVKCLGNHVADKAKAAATRGSAKKAPASKANGKRSTKASGKAKRKRAGTPCKAEDCDINLVTAEAKWTGYCAKHQQENRQNCQTEDCRHGLHVLREMKSGYCTRHLAADLNQPPVWSESIQADTLGFIIERRPTLDGWANLLLKADIPPNSTANGAAAEAGGQLFTAIGKHFGDRPRVWSNAIDVEIPADWFDYRADAIRQIVANGRVQYLARQLSTIVTANQANA
jgi:Helix-turn-helix domain